jgi:osmotically inducible protein OsmC
MPVRNASAVWEGDLKQGGGTVKLGSGAFEGKYSFNTRFEGAPGTNPEELIGAAHAGCFSMALAHALSGAGHTVTSITTTATVHLTKGDKGYGISGIDLATRGVVPGLPEADFKRFAEETKVGCIVSRALAAVPTQLDAQLSSA